MEQMKTFTVGADTWEIVDGAARDEIEDARTGADGTEYESIGAAIRGAVSGINDDLETNYAAQDGYYEMLTAGAADNLTGRGDAVGTEFIYHPTKENGDVSDGVARIEGIHGNTLVFNQFVKAPTANNSNTADGITLTSNTDGSYTLNGTLSASKYLSSLFAGGMNCRTHALDSDHKFLFIAKAAVNVFSEMGIESKAWNTANKNYVFVTTTSNYNESNFQANIKAGTYDNVKFYPQIFDLTRMFGAGNEPATVAEFEALFPESYYPYDAGSLLNVNMDGVRTVGFNQWDEEWELGALSEPTGEDVITSDNLRSKNYIPVFPDTDYYFQCPSNVSVRYYDANKVCLGAFDKNGRGDVTSDRIRTTPSNCRYIRFFTWNDYGATYNNDICINLSWSGYRNGEFEEYWQQERAIDTATYFPDGMKSAGSVYDELTADKAVKRVGAVMALNVDDMLDDDLYPGWSVDSLASIVGNDVSRNVIGAFEFGNYLPIGINTLGNPGLLMLTKASYGLTSADWKSQYAGKTFNFYLPLAEPIETDISPEMNLTYKVSDFGTEEIIVSDGERTAPVPMRIVYGVNAVDTIRRLPVNYISHKSMAQFIAAIEGHFNVTITETYDSDNERYNYSISTNESGE